MKKLSLFLLLTVFFLLSQCIPRQSGEMSKGHSTPLDEFSIVIAYSSNVEAYLEPCG